MEMKRCGCGGEAKLIHPPYARQAFSAQCNLCGIETPAAFDNGQSAIIIWNRAMSGQPAPAGEPSEALVERVARAILPRAFDRAAFLKMSDVTTREGDFELGQEAARVMARAAIAAVEAEKEGR